MIGCEKAIAVVLAVNFDVSPLSAVTCSQLDFTELINSNFINSQIALLGRLLKILGGRLAPCGAPSVICNDMVCSLMQLSSDCHMTLVCRVEG